MPRKLQASCTMCLEQRRGVSSEGKPPKRTQVISGTVLSVLQKNDLRRTGLGKGLGTPLLQSLLPDSENQHHDFRQVSHLLKGIHFTDF